MKYAFGLLGHPGAGGVWPVIGCAAESRPVTPFDLPELNSESIEGHSSPGGRLAWAPGALNTNTRELAYVVELDELEQAIWKTLDRIRQRDGAKIANEVRGRLADSIAVK